MRILPPISEEFTRTIAERELTLVLEVGQRSLILRVGEPVRDVESVDSFDWRCPVQLVGRNKEALAPGIGVDSMQALMNAIKIAHIELEALERETGGQLEWMDEPGHGLPRLSLEEGG